MFNLKRRSHLDPLVLQITQLVSEDEMKVMPIPIWAFGCSSLILFGGGLEIRMLTRRLVIKSLLCLIVLRI